MASVDAAWSRAASVGLARVWQTDGRTEWPWQRHVPVGCKQVSRPVHRYSNPVGCVNEIWKPTHRCFAAYFVGLLDIGPDGKSARLETAVIRRFGFLFLVSVSVAACFARYVSFISNKPYSICAISRPRDLSDCCRCRRIFSSIHSILRISFRVISNRICPRYFFTCCCRTRAVTFSYLSDVGNMPSAYLFSGSLRRFRCSVLQS